MTPVRRRWAFGIVLAAVAALLIGFSTVYLLLILLILLGLSLISMGMIRVDARHLHLEITAATGIQVGEEAKISMRAVHSGRLFTARYIAVQMELYNKMFDTRFHQQFFLPLGEDGKLLDTGLEIVLCGETVLKCVRASVWDSTGLFTAQCTGFSETHVVCWPRRSELELVLPGSTAGQVYDEGRMQNRPGGNPSETFAVREYVPGDDIRAIHWKLSSKMETLFLREASEPLHYDVLLMPDLGYVQAGTAVSFQELDHAVSITVALGEALLRQGVSFCFAIPGKQGLLIKEVRDKREWTQLIAQWMGTTIPSQNGTGFHMFTSEHLEQSFTRLMIVSAGSYMEEVSGLGNHASVTVLNVSDKISVPVCSRFATDSETVQLPSRQLAGERYRIIC